MEEKLKEQKIAIIRYVDPEYPPILKDFGEYHIRPPLVLLVKGSLANLGDGVAIVGTRECSFYGHSMARKLAKTIATAGYFVASGLARGVDTEAHCGALEAPSGKTVAVLPWLDKIYPEENVKLAQDITKKGALISEYYSPPFEHSSTQARAAFVIRNRITSGLSRCIILIESGMSGGTYRQAIIAKEQGRKIFALKPKRENKDALEGFNKFIEMGATSIESAKPVLDYLKQYQSTKVKEKRIDSFYQRSLKEKAFS
jgi:DNA processing protein